MPHEIDEAFRQRLDRLECKTVLGQAIDSDSGTGNHKFDETYPLRFHLRQQSRYIWYELLKEGRQEQHILHAIDVVQRKFADSLFAYDETPVRKQNLAYDPAGDLLTDHWDAHRRMQLSEETDGEVRTSPLGRWCIDTDPTNDLELVEEDWLQNKELWQVDRDWTWAHVYDFLALLTIDAALSNIERDAPFKAAVAAARASEYHGIATAVRWSQTVETAAISTLGKRGSDVRHSSNRAAKDEAIQLHLAGTWPSQAQAARVIGRRVNKTERVVEKWLREHRRSTSGGTETP